MSEFEQLLKTVKDHNANEGKSGTEKHGDLYFLAHSGDSRVVQALNEIVLDEKHDTWVRAYAVEYLGEFGDATSLAVLGKFKGPSNGLTFGAHRFMENITRSMLSIYEREFPPEQAAAMKAAASSNPGNKLGPAFPRADVIMPGDSLTA